MKDAALSVIGQMGQSLGLILFSYLDAADAMEHGEAPTMPPHFALAEDKPPYDVLAELFELGQLGEEIDAEARRPLEDDLVRRFASSPEAKTLRAVQWCRCLMDLGASYFGATVATPDTSQFREVVFEIIPRQVSIKPRAAGEIIDELSAFYGFLGREMIDGSRAGMNGALDNLAPLVDKKTCR